MKQQSTAITKKEVSDTVFVVQEQNGKNIMPALKFGEMRALLHRGVQIQLEANSVIAELRAQLKDFGDQDYLLLIGDPAAIGLACAIALEVNHGKARFLKWDRRAEAYYSVSVDLNNGKSKNFNR